MEFISKSSRQERDAAAAATTTNNNINSPKPTNLSPRSDPNNPYPTTFVQADTSNFKQVVQMLTGSSTTTANSSDTFKQTPSPSSRQIPPKKQGFKLYERRNINTNNNNINKQLMINTLLSFPRNNDINNNNNMMSPHEILSPSVLDFPSLTLLSPVTPLSSNDVVDREQERYDKSSTTSSSFSEEEEIKAIAEKGFYLHPSPRDRGEEQPPPQLLPLFPLTSPRVSSAS